MSPRAALAVAGGLVLVNLAFARVAAEWSFVAALLSPGAHSSLGALAFGMGFLAVRLAVYVALPGAALGTALFLGVSWARGRF